MQEEEYSEGGWLIGSRVQRGHRDSKGTIRSSGAFTDANGSQFDGYRPVLEIQNTEGLGADGLKMVTLDLNGGSVGDSAGEIKIVVKNGEAFTAPASEGITNHAGYFCGWLGSDGAAYEPGDSVPAEVSTLTAQWKELSGGIKVGAYTWNSLLEDADFNVCFKENQRVEITASGEDGENVDIGYMLSNRKLTEDELKIVEFTAYAGAFTPEYGDEYIIYARLTDAFGKTRYISSAGIVLDNTAPVISGITEGEIYCEAKTVSIDETYIDSVTVKGSPVTLSEGKFILGSAEGSQRIVATDKVGNTAEITVTVNDGHTPSTDISDCTEEFLCRYCNQTATIAAQHDFGGSLQSDAAGHWHKCQNRGCSVCDTKEAHRWKKTVCEECGYKYVSKVSRFTTDDIKTSTDSKTAEKTTSATVKNVITEIAKNDQGESVSKVTVTVSQTLADKLASQAVISKSDAVEITVQPNSRANAAAQKLTELTMPKTAVETIANKTDASLVIKNDDIKITLNNDALKAAAAASGKEDIKINITANAPLTEAQKPALDRIGNRGAIFNVTLLAGEQEITDLGGGVMAITVPVPESLKDRNIAVVQIDDKGNCRKITSRTLTEGNERFAQFSHR